MKTKSIHKRARWLLTALLLSALSSWTASAALIEVNQTIWGMDCAPCAYSMEKALQKLPGVKHATVSLNKGDAVLTFASDSQTTLAEIQQTVRNSGFTPKDATVKVSGTLKNETGELRLEAGKASYTLKPSDKAKDAWRRLQKVADGSTLTIQGKSPADHPGQIIVLETKS